MIGLGRFGTAVATELCRLGHEVLAIDDSEDRVQSISSHVTHAVAGDARDPAVLRALGVRNYNCAIVAVADDVGNSALITMKLDKIGADKVVFPEHEMGVKLAQNLSSSNILNFIELSDDFGIVELATPKPWVGKSLRTLDVRAKYRVNIIAIRRGGDEHDLEVAPGADYVLSAGDVVVTLGRNEYIDQLHEL